MHNYFVQYINKVTITIGEIARRNIQSFTLLYEVPVSVN